MFQSCLADTFIELLFRCKQRKMRLKRIGKDKSPAIRITAHRSEKSTYAMRDSRSLHQDYDNCLIKYARTINARRIVVGAAIVPLFANKYPNTRGI